MVSKLFSNDSSYSNVLQKHLKIYSSKLVIIIAACSAVIFICCLCFAALHCINQIKLRRILEEASYSKNGLVVSIAIGQYGPRPHVSEIPGYFDNLQVASDVANLRTLSEFLNYSFLTGEDDGVKLSWTKDEIMDVLVNQVGRQCFDDNGMIKYDGLIVSVSSHGMHESIISSDYKRISRPDIHRCLSERYPQIRDIPRIFLFDACDGTRNRQATMDNGNPSDAHKGPNDSIDALQMETGWTSKTKNLDYNLVIVHGANDGFVSKMQNSDVGSYLT